MTELAGFDVIAEAHLETIIDLVHEFSPITNPVDGKVIYLFGGPVSTDLKVDLGPAGPVTIRVIFDAKLEPILHQPLAHIAITITGGSTTVAGRTLNHIGGQANIPVAIGFSVVPGPTPKDANRTLPELRLAGSLDLALDAPTRTLADATLGAGGTDRLTAGLRTALTLLLSVISPIKLPILPLTVVPGIDSDNPLQVSAPPTAAWIDQTTLGVFGYYRAAATDGDVQAKHWTDLGSSHEEFFDTEPGPFPVVPGRRVALIISAQTFPMVIGCRAVRDRVVRELVRRREEAVWRDWVRVRDRNLLLEQRSYERLQRYFLEEMAKDLGADQATLLDRARARIEAEVDDELKGRAADEEDRWLDSTLSAGPETAGGQETIDVAVPPPCGQGAVEVKRLHVEHAQSDLVPMLRHLDVRLGQGCLTAHYEVDGLLELITGDLTFLATGDMDVFLTVTEMGGILSSFAMHTPAVNVDGTGWTGDLLEFVKSLFEATGSWHAVMVFLSFVLQAEVTETLKKDFPKTVSVDLPDTAPFPRRAAEIRIDPESLVLAGLIGRRLHWNEFSPALFVDTTLEARSKSDKPAVKGELVLEATEWGCPAATFETTRTFWDETFFVRARLRDAPLPITISNWQIELGNFTWNMIGGARLYDPRPTWSREPKPIAVGTLSVPGLVERLDQLHYPYMHGDLPPEDVSIDVSGDVSTGWHIRLRGADGNFYVRFSVDATDGDGQQWHAETFVTHAGDQLQLPTEFDQYKADCEAKFGSWFAKRMRSMSPRVHVAHVHPGEPVMDAEVREAIAIRTLVEAGDPGAATHLEAAMEKFGPSVLDHAGQVEPLTVSMHEVR